MVKEQGCLLLDLREQPKQDGLLTLGVPLWDALDSMLAVGHWVSRVGVFMDAYRQEDEDYGMSENREKGR